MLDEAVYDNLLFKYGFELAIPLILGIFTSFYDEASTISQEFGFYCKQSLNDDFTPLKVQISSLAQPARTIMQNAPTGSKLISSLMKDLQLFSRKQLDGQKALFAKSLESMQVS